MPCHPCKKITFLLHSKYVIVQQIGTYFVVSLLTLYERIHMKHER